MSSQDFVLAFCTVFFIIPLSIVAAVNLFLNRHYLAGLVAPLFVFVVGRFLLELILHS